MKKGPTEAYKLPFMQILLSNSEGMLTNTNRGDAMSNAAADQQIAKQSDEVEVLFEKHSKFSKKITNKGQTGGLAENVASNLLKKSKDMIQIHLEAHNPENRELQNWRKPTNNVKNKKRRLVLANTCSAEQRRAYTVMAQKHDQAKELLDNHGKVRWDKLKYNKDELFVKPPIFAEQIIRFQDLIMDPNKDPLHVHQFNAEGFQGVTPEFASQVRRHNSDVRSKIDKNYWVQLSMLAFDKRLRNDTLAQKDEFKTQQQIESLKRQNVPFYFIKPEEIAQLRKIGLESPNMIQKKLCIKQLLEYEHLMRQFKSANPNMFKRKETFGVAGINIDLEKSKDNEAVNQSTTRQSAKKKKKPTMFSYNADQQQRNTQKLKGYIQYLENNKDLDKEPFNWNVQSFLPQEDPSPERVELVRFNNLFKSQPQTPCERHRRSLGYMNRPNWATTSHRLKANQSCSYLKNRPALIDIGPPNLGGRLDSEPPLHCDINIERLDSTQSEVVLDPRPKTQMISSKTSRICQQSRNMPVKTEIKGEFNALTKANGKNEAVLSAANISPSTQLSSTPMSQNPMSRSSFYQKIYSASNRSQLRKSMQISQFKF